jgi:hypothetical protein
MHARRRETPKLQPLWYFWSFRPVVDVGTPPIDIKQACKYLAEPGIFAEKTGVLVAERLRNQSNRFGVSRRLERLPP